MYEVLDELAYKMLMNLKSHPVAYNSDLSNYWLYLIKYDFAFLDKELTINISPKGIIAIKHYQEYQAQQKDKKHYDIIALRVAFISAIVAIVSLGLTIYAIFFQ